MIFDYIFYTKDESFDYGDFPGGTCNCITEHGFSIDVNKDDFVDIKTLQPLGDYADSMKDIKTLEELKEFIIKHLDECEDDTGKDCLMELCVFINDTIEKQERKTA